MKHLFPDAFVSPTGESFADAVPIPIFVRKQPPLGAGAVNPQIGLDKSLAFPFLTVKGGEKVYHCGVDVQRINPPTWTTLPPPFTCAVWLLAQGWTAVATAEGLERDPHTMGRWASAFGEGGPAALIFEQSGGSPLTGACKSEIIATNRPRHPWIPDYAGMTEWAR